MDCPVLSGIQRQTSASGKQSFLGKSLLIWRHSHELQWMKQIFLALVQEKIYKGHFLLKSTYSISREHNSVYVTASPQIILTNHVRGSREPNSNLTCRNQKSWTLGFQWMYRQQEKETRNSQGELSHGDKKTTVPTASFQKERGISAVLSTGAGPPDTNRALQTPWYLLLSHLKQSIFQPGSGTSPFAEHLQQCFIMGEVWVVNRPRLLDIEHSLPVLNQCHFEDTHTAKAHQHISIWRTDYSNFSPRVCHKTLVSETSMKLDV